MKKNFQYLSICLTAGAFLVAACNSNPTAPVEQKAATEEHSEHGEHGDHAEAKSGGYAAPTDAMIKAGQFVSFDNLKDGQEVKSPVHVKMDVHGMTIEPAGEIKEDVGHHHIVVDGRFIPAGEAIPQDSTHYHFGKGQTEADLTLKPGEHKITLQFGDGMHRSYGEKMSKTITIKVK